MLRDPFAVERRLDEYLEQHDLPSELSDEVGCRRLSLLCAVRKIRRVENLHDRFLRAAWSASAGVSRSRRA
jgi:hypothetical protein